MKPNTNLPTSAVPRKVVCPDLPMLSRFSLRTSPSSFPWDLSHWPINTFKPWLWKYNPQITLPPTVHPAAAKPAGKGPLFDLSSLPALQQPQASVLYYVYCFPYMYALFNISSKSACKYFITALVLLLFLYLFRLSRYSRLTASLYISDFLHCSNKIPQKATLEKKVLFRFTV